jgi:hypothetical protein
VTEISINVWMEDNFEKMNDFITLCSIVEQANSANPPKTILYTAEHYHVEKANEAVRNLKDILEKQLGV